jgi:hypothetical protein
MMWIHPVTGEADGEPTRGTTGLGSFGTEGGDRFKPREPEGNPSSTEKTAAGERRHGMVE